MRRLLPLLLAAALVACDSAAERAEGHYERAVAYLAEGDTARAEIELRTAFRLDRTHAQARLAYARILRDRGDTRQAFNQYQAVTEQHPELAEAHRDLAALALEVQDFDTAKVHAGRAFALDPADPMVRAVKASVDFRRGDDRPAAVAMAEGVLAEAPGNVLAHMVLVADRLAAQDLPGALARVDAGLAAVPGDQGLHLARLALLEQEGDMAAIGAELTEMNRRFPDNEGMRTALVRWHLKSGQPDAAEAVLRAAADAAGAAPGAALTLVQFLFEIQGPDAARAELEARAAAAADPAPYARALAGLDFAEGRTDAAIAAMRKLLEGATVSDTTRDLKVGLAEMLAATGDGAEAGRLLDEVLAEDRTHLAALELRAKAAIAADRPDAAIQDMRTALTVAPRDPEVMTIMAFAHERAGDRALMGERLALAVEVSNRGAEESLRYANFLMQENRPGPAEGVVTGALRRTPENRDLLDLLGRIHLARHDWDRAGQVADILRRQGDPVAAAMATALDTARLEGEGRPGESVALLESLSATGGGDARVLADLVRAQVAAGDRDAAQRTLDGALAEDPDSIPGRYLQAGLDAIEGRPAEAEALYRALIAADPTLPEPYQALFALLAGQGQADAATAALEAGIAAAPQNGRLILARAGLREAAGDIAGAIADYETLYARDSAEPVVANNLASLLTVQGRDPATLDRAFAIARRLRESRVPQFQDTYGWILFLRGDAAAAGEVLAAAAEALPGNAQVQFHRGEAALANGDRAAAKAAFEAALAADAAGSPLPQAEAARARLAELAAPAAVPGPAAPAAPATPPSDG